MSHSINRLHDKLVHVLVKWDEADSRREAKHGRVNIYRMGLLLKAAQEAKDEAADILIERDLNVPPEQAYVDAVTDHFTVSRRIHTFLKTIDPTVDVQHGHWVVRGERK